MNNWKTTLAASITALALGFINAGTASAQGYYDEVYDNRYGDRDRDYITVYEHCDFRGDSRSISVGEYSRMHEVGFGNDQISSIRVPRGMEVTIYEHDKFDGAYARVDRDIACFDRQWNDQVSSLKVSSDRYDDRRNDRYRDRNRPANDRHVTAANVSQVVFGNAVLQQLNQHQWQMNTPREGVSQFKEVSRDTNSVYLKNEYTAERVRIDLFTNDVTFVDREGRQQRYEIVRKQAKVTHARLPATKPKPRPGKGTITNRCFNFRAYTRGGNGGLRFHGKSEFYRFTKRAETGRVCHDGNLTMEINKNAVATDVIVEIDGHVYRFAPNEQHDAYKNTWYRKRIGLRVGQ